MDDNILVSFVIPCYNDVQYIEQAVHSALSQTFKNIEVIVVDDGSNIETKEVLKKIEPIITKLITQENQGQSIARNKGIKEAKGKFIVTLDSDDFFEKTFCKKAIDILLNNKEIKLVTCYTHLLFNDSMTSIYKPKGGSIDDFLYCNQALGAAMFLKADWESSGGYDENMRDGFEDWEFFLRLLKDKGLAYVIKEPLYNYRKREESTTLKANNNKYKILKYIYLKHNELYKYNFEGFISHLLFLVENEEKERLKFYSKIEYRIGYNFLRPLRFLKRSFSIDVKKLGT